MKKTTLALLVAVYWGLFGVAYAGGKELGDLKVLYVGKERTADYVGYLEGKVAHIAAMNRAEFKLTEADGFDVVMLDWPQGDEAREMRRLRAPLGAREQWKKPTVLLGSAGLNLAVAWKLKGGSGCTCMDPLAYDLREHEIFERPFRIDRSKIITIPTPADFQAELKGSETIQVLPLVDDYKRQRQSHPGWCTYSTDFAKNPDIEVFCGGVNHKTPTAAGLWRQGNLLHFGFEESPAQLNESGKQLLLNAIAYISRFTEDRPIAVTPSVFAGAPIAYPRKTIARWLRNPEYPVDFVKDLIEPKIWEQLATFADREAMAKWVDEHALYFYPNGDKKLEIDKDLSQLGLPFDDETFIDKLIAGLRSADPDVIARARRLLARYVPCGPMTEDAGEWENWWNANRQFAFALDAGDYCWYIDPVAKGRGIPSKELRGSKRADAQAGITASP